MYQHNNTLIFEAGDNPTPTALKNIDSEIEVPANYTGTNGSPELAQLFVQVLNEENLTLGELLNRTTNLEDFFQTSTTGADPVKLWNGDPLKQPILGYLARFGVSAPTASRYYYWAEENLTSILPSYEYTNYIALLAYTYKDKPLASILPTLKNMYQQAAEDAEETGTPKKLISLTIIKRYFALNKYLRSEGVILTAQQLYGYSSRWNNQEVLTLLKNGMGIDKVLRLHRVGFETVESILKNENTLPDTWIDELLGL